jgi:hypothetical protein
VEGSLGGLIETGRECGNGLSRFSQKHIRSVDPDTLKIPVREAEYTLPESALSPFQAEPTHKNNQIATLEQSTRQEYAAFLALRELPSGLSHHLLKACRHTL